MSENFGFPLLLSFNLCSILIPSFSHHCYVIFVTDIVIKEHTCRDSVILIAFHIQCLNTHSYNRILQNVIHPLLPFINSFSLRTHRTFGTSSCFVFIFIYFCKCIPPTLMHITLHNTVPVSLFCFVTVQQGATVVLCISAI